MDFAELSEKLKVASTATLTSVLRNKGLYNTFMHQVAPLTPDMQMVGRAFTLRYIPAREDLDEVPLDNLKDVQRVGIEQVTAGDVFVIDARGDTRAGTMGSILAARLQVRGCAGIVTDGAYRDSPTIVASGLPAYAAAMNAHTNKTIHHPSEIQVPIACGGVAVFPATSSSAMGKGSWSYPLTWPKRSLSRPRKWKKRSASSPRKSAPGPVSSAPIPPMSRPWPSTKLGKQTNRRASL